MSSRKPSRRHAFFARAVPALRKSRELDTEANERARVERWHAGLDRSFPSRIVPGFARRFDLATDDLGGFPSYTMKRRGTSPSRTVLYLRGGGFMAPIDPFHVKYAARLARALDAKVVIPDYPLAPEHSWRDSFAQVVDLAEKLATEDDRLVLAGDSAGGGYALAVAVALRDRGGAQADRLLLHAPWVDLTTSAPETAEVAERDPWLFIGKVHAYAAWWAGSPDDLGRPEVSPGLADLTGLPPALVFQGTRDLLWPATKAMVARAAEAGWPVTYVEEPDLIHVYSLLPWLPESAKAWRQTLGFLR